MHFIPTDKEKAQYRRRRLAFKLEILLNSDHKIWSSLGEFPYLSQGELLDSIEFLARLLNGRNTDRQVWNAIGILLNSGGEDADGVLFSIAVDRIAYLTAYFNRNRRRYPAKKVSQICLILEAMCHFRSQTFIHAVHSAYRALINIPTPEEADSIRRRLKLELLPTLCTLLQKQEVRDKKYRKGLGGLPCLVDMALSSCVFTSTTAFIALLSLHSEAPRRFQLITAALESLGMERELFQPGVGSQRFSLILSGRLFQPYADIVMAECMDEISK